MAVTFNPQFTGKERTQKQKDAEKKVITGGGALAAANVKATKGGVDLFATTKGLSAVNKGVATANTVTKKATTLWGTVCSKAKWAKDAIINWSSKFKNMKYIKPLVENRVFRACAGVLGFVFGLITLITGLSDIGKVAVDAFQ